MEIYAWIRLAYISIRVVLKAIADSNAATTIQVAANAKVVTKLKISR